VHRSADHHDDHDDRRYKGQCNYCHDPIEIGDRIRRDLDGVSWVHAGHVLSA
jgi:hypothetical protein